MAVRARGIEAQIAATAALLRSLIAQQAFEGEFARVAEELSECVGCQAAALAEVDPRSRTVRIAAGWSRLARGRLGRRRLVSTDEALTEMGLGLLEATVYVQPAMSGSALAHAFFEEGCDAVVVVNLGQCEPGRTWVLALGMPEQRRELASTVSILLKAIYGAAAA